MAKQVILLLLLLPCMVLAAPYGGMYPDAISSADIPDPLVPLDGCQGITGDLTASGTITGGIVMAEQLTSTDDATITDTLTAAAVRTGRLEPATSAAHLNLDLRDDSYRIAFRDAANVEQASVSATGVITGSALTVSGTVTGGTVTDGTAVMGGGNLTGLHDINPATATTYSLGNIHRLLHVKSHELHGYSKVTGTTFQPYLAAQNLALGLRNDSYHVSIKDASTVEVASISATGVITGSALEVSNGITLTEMAEPANPASGKAVLFVNATTHHAYIRFDSGASVQIAAHP